MLPPIHASSNWSRAFIFPYQNPACTSPFPLRVTPPTHLILLDFITQTAFGKEYRLLRFSLCSLLYLPVTSSLLDPNILLSTLFSKTLSLHCSINVSDQVSHPYKRRGKIIVPYISYLLQKYVQTGYEACPTSYSLATMSSFPRGRTAGA